MQQFWPLTCIVRDEGCKNMLHICEHVELVNYPFHRKYCLCCMLDQKPGGSLIVPLFKWNPLSLSFNPQKTVQCEVDRKTVLRPHCSVVSNLGELGLILPNRKWSQFDVDPVFWRTAAVKNSKTQKNQWIIVSNRILSVPGFYWAQANSWGNFLGFRPYFFCIC